MNNKNNGDWVHQKRVDVAWGDMDALGHVNNGRYFDYFQEARIEWLQSLQLDMKQNQGPVVIHVAATFLKPVVYPATLQLSSRIQTIGNSSLTMEHMLFQHQELVAQGLSKVVWVDYQINKAIPLPDTIRALSAK